MEEICICGHSKVNHWQDEKVFPGKDFCTECTTELLNDTNTRPPFQEKEFLHVFKLDNLAVVETEAKKRGLI